MCITTLPYCPPNPTQKLTSILLATTAASSHHPWFICEHRSPTPHPISSLSRTPTTCPNLEIRHPGFNGTICRRCTAVARTAAATINREDEAKSGMVRTLEEEIVRLEGVVANMKRKLAKLRGKGEGGFRGGGGGMI